MLWTTTWPPSSVVPTILVICAVLAWWFTEPKSTHLNLIVLLGCLLFYWAVAPELAQETPFWILQNSATLATVLRLDTLVLYHSNMLVTGAAILWYVTFQALSLFALADGYNSGWPIAPGRPYGSPSPNS